MRIAGILAVGVIGTLSLSGCHRHFVSCHQSNKDYAGAKELPPLKAPPNLEAPDTRNALKVPALNTPERVRGRDEPCLDSPPPFDSKKPLTAPAPEPRKPSDPPRSMDAPKPQ